MTIKSKLSIAVSLVFIAFSLVISLIAQDDFSAAYRDNVERDLRQLNFHYAASLAANIAQAESTLAKVAAAISAEIAADPRAAQRFLDERIALRSIFPGGLLLVNGNGVRVAAAATPEYLLPENFRPGPPSGNAVQLIVVPPVNGALKTKRLPVVIGIPLAAAGTTTGTLYGALDLHQLAFHANTIPDQQLPTKIQLIIGTAKYSHNNDDGQDGARLEYGLASAEELAFADESRLQHNDLVYQQTSEGVILSVWSRLQESGWVISSSVPSAAAFAPLVAAERKFALAVSVGTLVMLLAARFMARRLTTALYTMTKTIRDMEQYGQLQPLGMTRNDEVGELARAFDRMAMTIDRQQRDLNAAVVQARDAAARSDAIIAALGDGISIQDRNLRILYQNDIHRQMIGSHLGETCYEAYHPGNHQVCPGCPVALAMDDGNIHRFENSTTIDDRTITVEIIASPLRNADGEIVAGIELVRNISESKAAERQIQQLNHELQLQAAELAATNLELQAFSSSLSHDLKTPLTAIFTSAQILADGYKKSLDDSGRYLIDTICTTCERFEEILDGMLLLSHIGQCELYRMPVNLSELAHEIVLGLRVIDPQRQVTVQIADDLQCEGDPRLIRSLLGNLIGNAWKYSAHTAAAHIEIGTSCDNGHNVFYVRDNGAGFDMRQYDRLFRPFQRLHPSEDFAGSGIGLATVERIVKRHGGTIRAESVPGQGASFYFTLS